VFVQNKWEIWASRNSRWWNFKGQKWSLSHCLWNCGV